MTAVQGQLEIQNLPVPRQPAWFTAQNGVFDDARDKFRLGTLVWSSGTTFLMRLFSALYTPNFALATTVGDVNVSAWIAPAVALANVRGERGYCQSDGVHFPNVTGGQQLAGAVIYKSADGTFVWAATDLFGNLPLTNQSVYIVPPASFNGAWFRL